MAEDEECREVLEWRKCASELQAVDETLLELDEELRSFEERRRRAAQMEAALRQEMEQEKVGQLRKKAQESQENQASSTGGYAAAPAAASAYAARPAPAAPRIREQTASASAEPM